MKLIHVIGVDDVGNGALAGPVVTAAVLAPKLWSVDGLKDSKRFNSRDALSAVARRVLADGESHVEVYIVSPQQIDKIGLMAAVVSAQCEVIKRCMSFLQPKHDAVTIIIDGNVSLPLQFPYHCIPQAEDKFKQVAAASIVAKHTRDAYMVEVSEQYPEYGFASSVGYGTAEHRAALNRYGACPIHRMSVTPVRDAMFFRGDLTMEAHEAQSSKGRMREKL